MIRSTMSWLGAAAIAAVVAGGAFMSGCGAAPEDEQDEIGQTAEPLIVFALGAGRTYGVDTTNNDPLHSFPSYAACTTSTAVRDTCRWMHPYEWHPFGTSIPSRRSVIIANGPDQATVQTILNNNVLPNFNGELIATGLSWDTTQTGFHSLVFRLIPDTVPPMPSAPPGDIQIKDYIKLSYQFCQTKDRIETPSEPGSFRSCDALEIQVNTVAIHNNFPGHFNSTMKQILYFGLDAAQGLGIQNSVTPAFTNPTLNATVQAMSAPFTAIEKKQVEVNVFEDEGAIDTEMGFKN